MRRLALILVLLAVTGCASHDAPGCRGEVFDLNPQTRATAG
jgi:hypothetical protein